MVSDRIHLTRVERELGITYCREITECEDAEKTCLAAGTVSDDDELPTSLIWLAKQFRRLNSAMAQARTWTQHPASNE